MTRRTRHAVCLTALSLACLLAVGCAKQPTVYDITKDREKWHRKQVKLEGDVGVAVSAMGTSVYEFSDDTGTIWVLTRASAPSIGDHVQITARVNERLSLGVVDVGVHLVETKRKRVD